MYSHIGTWRNWIDGTVKGVHSYYQKVDTTSNRKRKMKRRRTNMLLKASEDWASILLNEKTQITVEDDAAQKYLMGEDEISGVLGRTNFWACANGLIATSRWSGTAAFEIYIKKMDVSEEDGKILSGDDIGINFLSAEQIIPISYENRTCTECAFASEKTVRGEPMTTVTAHTRGEDGTYNITIITLDKSGTVTGEPQTLKTGSLVPWFAIVRKSGENTYDPESPFGVSIVSGSEDVLVGLDVAFDNFITDFILGRKMVLMSQNMLNTNKDGEYIPPQDDDIQVFVNAGDSVLDGKMYQEYNPKLRVDENSNGLQKMLDMFSFKVGFGTKHYQFDGQKIVTATEYVGDKQDLVQNASKEMIVIEAALKSVITAILWIGKYIIGENINNDAKITIDFDDGYIIDEDTERKQWIEDVKNGFRKPWEYRVKYFGETEEEAKRNAGATLDELLKGKSAGAVKEIEIRRALFPNETEEESEAAIEYIRKNEPTLGQLVGE